MWETQGQSLSWKIPWRSEWKPTLVFLPGKSHRQRSLVGYRPWGCKESDTTEGLTLSLPQYKRGFPGGSVVKNLPANAGDTDSIPGSGRSPGEGNGNPLQYSCLGNPIDRGAWWAMDHGVAKSQTRLSDWARTEKESSFTMLCYLQAFSPVTQSSYIYAFYFFRFFFFTFPFWL